MKLIDLLVQEFPKRGGWPDGVNRINQAYDGRLEDYHKDGDSYPLKINDAFPLTHDHRGKAEYVHESGADFVTREQYEAAIAAAQHLVWNGKGLPPVGCECEYQDSNNSKWYPVTIKYVSDQLVVICGVTNILGEEQNTEIAKDIVCDKPQFRPIRSERDKVIAEMRKVVTNYNKTDVIHAIEQLYDAGYRKLSD